MDWTHGLPNGLGLFDSKADHGLEQFGSHIVWAGLVWLIKVARGDVDWCGYRSDYLPPTSRAMWKQRLWLHKYTKNHNACHILNTIIE